jgi:hypothetical protein
MKTTILGFALALSTAACSKKAASCDAVFEHIKSLAPGELGQMMEKTKDAALAKCEKLSADAKQCALSASSMEELQKCPRE